MFGQVVKKVIKTKLRNSYRLGNALEVWHIYVTASKYHITWHLPDNSIIWNSEHDKSPKIMSYNMRSRQKYDNVLARSLSFALVFAWDLEPWSHLPTSFFYTLHTNRWSWLESVTENKKSNSIRNKHIKKLHGLNKNIIMWHTLIA